MKCIRPALLLILLTASTPLPTEIDALRLEQQLSRALGEDRIDLLVELGAALETENPTRALEVGEEALDLLRDYPDQAQEIRALNSLACARFTLGDYEEALAIGSRAQDLARRAGDQAALASALRNAGRVYRSSSEFQRALTAYAEAVDLFATAGDQPGLGDALNDTGVVYWMMGDYSQAMAFFLRSQKAFEETGDRQRQAKILNNLGMLHRKLGEHERALDYYREALVMRREVGPKGALSNVLNNLGNIHRDLGNADAALGHYLQALEVGPQDAFGHSNTVLNLGDAYNDLGRLDDALRQYLQALEMKRSLDDRRNTAYLLTRIANIHRQQDDASSGLEFLEQAIAIADGVEEKEALSIAYLELSETQAALGRFDDALNALREHQTLSQQISADKSHREIVEMQARFEIEHKEKEIELLKQQQVNNDLLLAQRRAQQRTLLGGFSLLILVAALAYHRHRSQVRTSRRRQEEKPRQEERERYIAQLEASKAEVEAHNAEMERFTYTVSHDLKSPVVTIRGFISLIKQDLLAGDERKIAQDIERIDTAANKMADLLEELLDLCQVGRLVNAPEPIAMSALAEEAVELLATEIDERGAKIEIAPDLPSVMGDRRRLLEVLQNLIENALKFTRSEVKPRISVGFRRADDGFAFFVRDNGSGIAPPYHKKVFGLFDRLQPEIEGDGVGLALVKRIVEWHGGRIWVESDGKDHGSTFCFTLPGKFERVPLANAEPAGG